MFLRLPHAYLRLISLLVYNQLSDDCIFAGVVTKQKLRALVNEGDISPRASSKFLQGVSMRQLWGISELSFLLVMMFFFMLGLSTLKNKKPANLGI